MSSTLFRIRWDSFGESQALSKLMSPDYRRPRESSEYTPPTARRERKLARLVGGVTPPAQTKTVLAAGRVPTSVDNREARRP